MPHAADTRASKPDETHKHKSAPQRALEKLGLLRDVDLALHLPMRYEDETRITRIASARPDDIVQVQGRVTDCRVEVRARRQLLVQIEDGSAELLLRFLNFYPAHKKALAVGAKVRVRGELRGGFLGREMVHPSFKVVDDDAPLATALTPVYPTSAQLPQAYLRKAVVSAMARTALNEILPAGTVPHGLPPLRDALNFLHHPAPSIRLEQLEDHSHPTWRRLKFEELLAQQLSQLQAQRERALMQAPALYSHPAGLHEQLLATLPFELTRAQRHVTEEIAQDLQKAQPMHRLLQGDVGSGKTVVAALAALIVIDAGWQCALMAPTEILAEQHFRKLVGWLEALGVSVAWLTSSHKGKARLKTASQIADGSSQLVVGTHAVIQERIEFSRLGLAIIDEQHRFGVLQRLSLRRQRVGELEPHLLMMSATPIPRTLAMTYFADLNVSTIAELPPGRTPVVTKVFANRQRDKVVERVRDQVAQGRQAYWVCPLIEESEVLDLRNATETHQQLLEALSIGEKAAAVSLLHGRMSGADKASVMSLFIAGQTSVLVSTTVIEVGVDVPNASLMVIEHAERLGLSQLHQLRGRVGRGPVASVCVLLYEEPLSLSAKARLKAMSETNDGFEIARRDLEIRGPGEFMGARQSGATLLRFADLNRDGDLLQHARDIAPRLLDQHAQAARQHVARWLGSKVELLKA